MSTYWHYSLWLLWHVAWCARTGSLLPWLFALHLNRTIVPPLSHWLRGTQFQQLDRRELLSYYCHCSLLDFVQLLVGGMRAREQVADRRKEACIIKQQRFRPSDCWGPQEFCECVAFAITLSVLLRLRSDRFFVMTESVLCAVWGERYVMAWFSPVIGLVSYF